MEQKRTQDEFIKQVESLNKGFTVVGQYIGARVPVDIRCSNEHIWSVRPTNLFSHNSGCPYCANKAVLIGYNDMWTTAPTIAKLLVNPEDGYKYTKCSGKKVYFKCPDCGDVSYKAISRVYTDGLVCQKCSDGISYPNKFARAFLSQLPVQNVMYEYSPEWANLYKYDNYFEYQNKKYILEMDGVQHFKEIKIYKRSLSDIKIADDIKNNMASEHNICAIRIDCSISNAEYIKDSICNSLLNTILDLSCVDWMLCEEMAQKNIAKEVCCSYNTIQRNTVELGKMFGISRCTVDKYLKMGTTFGWCNYSPQISNELNGRKRSRPIVSIDQDGMVNDYFNGCYSDISKIKHYYNIKNIDVKIRESCRTHKPYKGINFRYTDEYLPKEIIDEIKLKDNAEEVFFYYLKQNIENHKL